MPNKISRSTVIISALSLVVLAFVTYTTVYEHILSQNNGFFNAIIFGVVLILIFIFITLIARIVGLRPESETSVLINYLQYVLLLAIFVLFVIMKLRYSSSVPTTESVPFMTANYLRNGNLSEGNELSNNLINFPANFVYAFKLSIIFRIFGATPGVYTVTNVIFMVLTALFVFLTVYFLSNKACAYVAVIIMLFMPGNAFLVYSYNSELSVAADFMLSFYLYCLLIFKRFKSNIPVIIISSACGLLSGMVICSEPTLILAYIVLFIWVIFNKKQPRLSIIIMSAVSAASALILTLIKVGTMKASFGKVLVGYFKTFVPLSNRKLLEKSTFKDSYKAFMLRLNNPSRFLSENFYFLTSKTGNSYSDNQAVWLKLADQLIYIFMLLMCVILIVYLLRSIYNKVLPGLSVLLAVFFAQFLGGINDVSYFYFMALVTSLGTCALYYMYLNHHQDYAMELANIDMRNDLRVKAIREGKYDEHTEEADKSKDTTEVVSPLSPDALRRARAIVFIGENDELYEQIKEQERIDRINNPVVTTRIMSQISESGEYESKEEAIEFLDDLDKKVEVKEVHEVKAIPSTRPVEVVKPQLAESYEYEDDIDFNKDIAKNYNNDLNNFELNDNIDKAVKGDTADTSDVQSDFGGASKLSGVDSDYPDVKYASDIPDIDDYDDIQDAVGLHGISDIDGFSDAQAATGVQDISDNQAFGADGDTYSAAYGDTDAGIDGDVHAGIDGDNNKYAVDGFIFRRKASGNAFADRTPKTKKAAKKEMKLRAKQEKESAKVKKQLEKQQNAGGRKKKNADDVEKQNTLGRKKQQNLDSKHDSGGKMKQQTAGGKKKLSKPKPGEPLDNPLPLPKPHTSKDIDFDYKVSDDDDFDW